MVVVIELLLICFELLICLLERILYLFRQRESDRT